MLPDEKSLPTMLKYCRQQNIPFNMNEKRFYQIAKYEHSKNSWYHALASFFHKIDIKFRVRGQGGIPGLKADGENHFAAGVSNKTSTDDGKRRHAKRATLDLKNTMSSGLADIVRQRQMSSAEIGVLYDSQKLSVIDQ